MTHVTGRAAVERYGDSPDTYARGDQLCAAGYYHGAIETFVVEIGAGKILEEAGEICADLGERQQYSVYHRDCAHGLGHGFNFARVFDLCTEVKAISGVLRGHRPPCSVSWRRLPTRVREGPRRCCACWAET